MKTIASTVKQLTITGADRLDPIRVILEDFGQGRGMITITCFGEAWSNLWGAMGEGAFGDYVKIEEFFATCSTDYLVCKLKTGIQDTVCDEEAQDRGCRAEVLKARRSDDITKKQARELWDRIDYADFDQSRDVNSDLFFDIFGDEWWHQLPQRPNPDYVYLSKIVDAVKAGLRVHAESDVPA